MCLYAGRTIAVGYEVFKTPIVAKSISNVSYSRNDDRNAKLIGVRMSGGQCRRIFILPIAALEASMSLTKTQVSYLWRPMPSNSKFIMQESIDPWNPTIANIGQCQPFPLKDKYPNSNYSSSRPLPVFLKYH